jgi:hypothetical protein
VRGGGQLRKVSNIEMALSRQKIRLAPDEPVTLEITYKEALKKKTMEIELEIKEHFGSAGKGSGRPSVGPAR